MNEILFERPFPFYNGFSDYTKEKALASHHVCEHSLTFSPGYTNVSDVCSPCPLMHQSQCSLQAFKPPCLTSIPKIDDAGRNQSFQKTKSKSIAKAQSARSNPLEKRIAYLEQIIEATKIILRENGIPFPGNITESRHIISKYNNEKEIDSKYKVNSTNETCLSKLNREEIEINTDQTKGQVILSNLLDLSQNVSPKRNRFDNEMIEIAFLLYNSSPKSYDIMRQLKIPFPDRSTVYLRTKDKIKEINDHIMNPGKIHEIIMNYFIQNDINDFPLYINIAVDAMSVQTTFTTQTKSKYIPNAMSEDLIFKMTEKIKGEIESVNPYIRDLNYLLMMDDDDSDFCLTESEDEDFELEASLLREIDEEYMNELTDTESIGDVEKDQINIIENATIISTTIEQDNESQSETNNPDNSEKNKVIKYLFNVMMLPINPNYPKLTLRIITSSTGMMNQNVFNEITSIIEELSTYNVNTLFVSSDGDRFFDTHHRHLFDLYYPFINEYGSFAELASTISNNHWFLSDFLHLLKIGCSRIKKKPILIYAQFSTTNCDVLCTYTHEHEYINEILKLGDPLLDKSSAGKLKDSYPIALFSVINVLKLINSDCLSDALYLLPYSFLLESIRNPIWSRTTRIKLLEISFKLFLFLFDNQSQNIKILPDFVSEKDNGAEVLTFATSINIIRIINTIIGVAFVVMNFDEVGIERLATHLLECFFGNIRMNAVFKENYKAIILNIAKNILANQIKTKHCLKTVNKSRLTQAGVKVTIEEKELVELEIPDDVTSYIFNVFETQQMNQESLNLIQRILQNNEINEKKITKCYLQSKISACKIIERFISNE